MFRYPYIKYIQIFLQAIAAHSQHLCTGLLTDIMGRYKTFSSGDAMLGYILSSPILAQILSSTSDISVFVTSVLAKGNAKIYDPHLEKQVNIFRLSDIHC